MEVFILESLFNTIKNLDAKTKKIMTYGIYFSLLVSIIGASLLVCYISLYHSNFIYYIGKEIVHLSISWGVSFFACALVIDKIKKDLE